MSQEEKTRNTDQLSYTKDTERLTSNGRLSTLMLLRRNSPRDWMLTSDSISTDHSTPDQECQCKESSNVLELTMLHSRDGERMLWDNNGTSIVSLRPSRISNGNHIHSTFRAMVEAPMSDVPQPTQDGGKCGD